MGGDSLMGTSLASQNGAADAPASRAFSLTQAALRAASIASGQPLSQRQHRPDGSCCPPASMPSVRRRFPHPATGVPRGNAKTKRKTDNDRTNLDVVLAAANKQAHECGGWGRCQFLGVKDSLEYETGEPQETDLQLRQMFCDVFCDEDLLSRPWDDEASQNVNTLGSTLRAIAADAGFATLKEYEEYMRRPNSWGDSGTLIAASIKKKVGIRCATPHAKATHAAPPSHHATHPPGTCHALPPPCLRLGRCYSASYAAGFQDVHARPSFGAEYVPTRWISIACINDAHFYSTRPLPDPTGEPIDVEQQEEFSEHRRAVVDLLEPHYSADVIAKIILGVDSKLAHVSDLTTAHVVAALRNALDNPVRGMNMKKFKERVLKAVKCGVAPDGSCGVSATPLKITSFLVCVLTVRRV